MWGVGRVFLLLDSQVFDPAGDSFAHYLASTGLFSSGIVESIRRFPADRTGEPILNCEPTLKSAEAP